MDSFPVRQLSSSLFPPLLLEIPDAPKRLYVRGALAPWGERAFLCVVGSRHYTRYGKEVVDTLIRGLQGYPITIVSGLAIGIDGLAHESALANNIPTVSIPGSGLDDTVLYPRQHRALARRILEGGGCLLSEYDPLFKATQWSFLKRNRIMAGMSHATLIIEASEKSGTLVTARLAMEYNRDVLTVPGSIFSKNSFGPHMLIREGATPIHASIEIVHALGLTENSEPSSRNLFAECSAEEKRVLNLLHHEPLSKDALIRQLPMSTSDANILLTLMELQGLIHENNGALSTAVHAP